MHRLGRLERAEGDQRRPRGIADKHYDLHAGLRRERRYIPTSQYDGSGECRSGAGANANTDINANTGSCRRPHNSATHDFATHGDIREPDQHNVRQNLDPLAPAPHDSATDDSATHGGNFGEPDQHSVWQNLDRDLVLDQRNLMHRLGRVERDEADQRHPRSIADRHYDLHAGLHRERRYVPGGQCDGSGECRPDASQRRVRIGEWHDGIVYTFDQPLLRRHGVVRGGLGPVDMDLQRF